MVDIQKLQGARALITGGAGLIGSHIADQLIRAGVREVVVLDDLSRGRIENLAQARASGKLTVVEGDIRDIPLLAEVVQGIDLVFHMAAIRLTQCAEQPRLALEVMVDGTFNVVEAAVRAGVSRVVAASSASIYGEALHFPITEEHHPYRNHTIYGAAKMFTEGLLASFRDVYGLDFVALRYFNVYGPRMDIHGAYTEVLVRWMNRVDSGCPPLIFGDGNLTMDLVYVEDVARANVLAAASDLSGEVMNVATGVETSLKDLAHALLAVMGSDLGVEYGPERAVASVVRRVGDTQRARQRLGFRAQVDVQEGLRRLVRWWRTQKDNPAAPGIGA